MKPDWDELGEKFEDSKKVLIGDVDCTEDSAKALCERFGVTGYPTLKYWNQGDQSGETYEGGRTLKDFKKFIKTLGPACTAGTLENCSAKQKAVLQPYLDLPTEDLAATLAADTAELASAQSEHDALLKELQSKFEESDTALKALKEEKEPTIKLMRAATIAPAAAKDEV